MIAIGPLPAYSGIYLDNRKKNPRGPALDEALKVISIRPAAQVKKKGTPLGCPFFLTGGDGWN